MTEKDEKYLTNKCVVIDNGSYLTRVGFAGHEQPSSIFPTCIGYPRWTRTIFNDEPIKDHYIGVEAMQLKGIMGLNYPIQHGEIRDWESMRKIWEYIFFSELRINPTEHALLLTEPPFNPNKNREKIAKIMFEDFEIPALYIGNQALLTLNATGRHTGCVVNIGEDGTYIVPIVENHAIKDCIKRIDIGGKAITECFRMLLRLNGHKFVTSGDFETIRGFKEKYCYIALDYDKEIERSKTDKDFIKTITRPSGRKMSLSKELFTAPEVLFQPKILNEEVDPLHVSIVISITECPDEIQPDLFKNIVLSGGTTMIPGLQRRLSHEVQAEIERRNYVGKINIVALENRMNLVWFGGSALASSADFLNQIITKSKYRESGIETLHKE